MRLLLACDAAAKPPIEMLQRAGVVCDVLAGLRGLRQAEREGYDLVLLAAGTGGDALPALTAYRRDGAGLPALVLAANLSEGDEAALLDAGADEVLPETTSIARLLARMRAAARRPPPPQSPHCGNLALDFARRTATVGDRHLALTGSEFALLTALVEQQGRLLNKAACREALYAGGIVPESRTIDVFVCRLRRKLATARAEVLISTVWSRGYVLQEGVRRAALNVSGRTQWA